MLEALLEALVWCATQILRMLLWVLVDLIGYATTRVLTPILTFGWTRVDPGPLRSFLWRRTPQGMVLGKELAVLLGQLFWIVVLITIATAYRSA